MPARELIGIVVFDNDWYQSWCLSCYKRHLDYVKAKSKQYMCFVWPLYADLLGDFSARCFYCGHTFYIGSLGLVLFEEREWMDCEEDDCDGECETGWDRELTSNMYPQALAENGLPKSKLPEV